MNIAGECVNTTHEKMATLIAYKLDYISNPNTPHTVESILRFAQNDVGLQHCYDFDDLRYYIDAYNEE